MWQWPWISASVFLTPTATKPMQHNRRHWLQGMALLACTPLRSWAAHPAAPQFAAAWSVDLELHVGVVQLPASADAPLHIVHAHAVPTRAHGMTQLADGSLLFASRRPGDWLLRVRPDGSEQWHWIEPDRAFNGHVIASHDGKLLYTTETDLADSQGLIGVRDANSLEKISEWRTAGMDPHQLLLDRDGSLMVANGGIPTQPETGRRKLKLTHMDSSIVRLNPPDQGAITGQWRLADPRLSLRHLAWGPTVAWNREQRWLGIALQAEHDTAEQKQQAPVLALFDGERLHAAPLPSGAEWQGYGGDISCHTQHFAVSCPRADLLTWWQPPQEPGAMAQCLRQDGQQGVYCISNDSVLHPLQPDHSQLWTGGVQQVRHWPQGSAVASSAILALDNHWVRL